MLQKIILVLMVLAGLVRPSSSYAKSAPCVRIYYDAVESDPTMTYFGRIHALFLENVLGHWPHLQVYVSPLSKYQWGDLDLCKANIYLGTYYDAPMPESFKEDVATTASTIAWAGYNIWRLPGETLKEKFGIQFEGLTTLSKDTKDKRGQPGFFKFYSYNGETFEKYGDWDAKVSVRFNAAFEIARIKALGNASVLSWAKHSTGQEADIPWAVNHDRYWYFGDSPFSFMTESDRYLIFCDLLFDILKEKPRRLSGPKPALFRVEDVHPMVPLWQLFNMVDLLKKHQIPFSVTLVPIFSDPFQIKTASYLDQFVPITRDKSFHDFLNYAKQANGKFIYHGVTHQHGNHRNPFNGITGDDFEFWDRARNQPIEEESVPFILNRLEDGLSLMSMVGIKPIAWLTPHYQASPLAYKMFSQLFNWNVGRVTYFTHKYSQSERLPQNLAMDAAGVEARASRKKYFKDISVTYDQTKLPSGQFYPFEIYGDVYGQRIIPENIGNVQPYMNEQVLKTETVPDMIIHLKRNRVLRDSWGSFFIHPFRLSTKSEEGLGAFAGDTMEVERLIRTAKEYGYEFIDLEDWMKQNTLPLRRSTIETFP